MATKIVTKNSSTASAVPTASDLVQGELAVNVADKRLFTEDNAGAIVELGVNPAAEITANAGIALPDSQKATFGAGDDLQIYHNGSHSFIKDVGTGNLYIDATSLYVRSATGEPYIVGTADAGVSIYHDNAIKLATTSTGIDVTGSVTADGLTASTSGNQVMLLDSVAGATSIQMRTGSGSISNFIRSGIGGSANLRFETTGNVVRQKIDANGDISFYEDTGTTPKLFWDASAESLGIGTSSPAAKLDVAYADNANIFRASYASSEDNFFLELDSAILTGGVIGYQFHLKNNGTSYNNMLTFDRGNVGIGTSSPSSKLDVAGTYRMQLRTDDAVPELRATTADGSAFKELGLNGLDLRFFTSSTERMRIDSSGNLLVGKTSTSSGVVGHRFNPNGSQESTTNGGLVAYFNRKTSDGEIARFDKDGAAVGSIGSSNGGERLYMVNDSTGLVFLGDFSKILPCDSAGAPRDNAIDLGQTGGRFKDLYLSGTANLNFINHGETIYPTTDAAVDVGTSSERYRNLYLSGQVNTKTIAAQRGDAGSLIQATSSSGNGSGIINFMSSLTSSSNNANCVHYQGTTQNINSWKLLGNGTSTWSSDINLKRDIETTRDGYLDDIKQLRVVKYKWKNDPDSETELGLIAQEVEDIFPSLVTEDKNSVGDEVLYTEEDEIPTGKTVGDVKVEGSTYKGVKYGVIPLILLKAIQEQQTLIESLTTRIAALEE